MASRATEDTDDGKSGEFPRPNAAKAFQIYDEFIAPKKAAISTLTGDCSEPWQEIKKLAHFPRPVMNFILTLENIDDEAKRDHYLIALAEGLKHRGLTVPDDLVSRAEGSSGADVVPISKRGRAPLATLDAAPKEDNPFPMGVPSDGTETDLADAGEDLSGDELEEPNIGEGYVDQSDEFTEATDEELAQQEGRDPSLYERMRDATFPGESENTAEAAE